MRKQTAHEAATTFRLSEAGCSDPRRPIRATGLHSRAGDHIGGTSVKRISLFSDRRRPLLSP